MKRPLLVLLALCLLLCGCSAPAPQETTAEPIGVKNAKVLALLEKEGTGPCFEGQSVFLQALEEGAPMYRYEFSSEICTAQDVAAREDLASYDWLIVSNALIAPQQVAQLRAQGVKVALFGADGTVEADLRIVADERGLGAEAGAYLLQKLDAAALEEPMILLSGKETESLFLQGAAEVLRTRCEVIALPGVEPAAEIADFYQNALPEQRQNVYALVGQDVSIKAGMESTAALPGRIDVGLSYCVFSGIAPADLEDFAYAPFKQASFAISPLGCEKAAKFFGQVVAGEKEGDFFLPSCMADTQTLPAFLQSEDYLFQFRETK